MKQTRRKASSCNVRRQQLQGLVQKLGKRLGITPELFAKTNAVLQSDEVKGTICRIMADYIGTVHAGLLRQYRALDAVADLTQPHEWFPEVRNRPTPRRIIYHGGPTNSGKTYQAMQRLEQAATGMYYGPLRLLAAEVYDTMTEKGIRCNLYTGQERRVMRGATHGSATIEMAYNGASNPLLKGTRLSTRPPTEEEEDDEEAANGTTPKPSSNTKQDNDTDSVVVIDEIQMIADPERGFAWTRALLGLNCSEIHVCGGLEAVDLVRKLVEEKCGDDFELRTYKRFTPLQVESHSLQAALYRKQQQWEQWQLQDEEANQSNKETKKTKTNKRNPKHQDDVQLYPYALSVRPGDCIVAFNRRDIFAVKREIESRTKFRCCVVYGSLPPQTRAEQARLFNDPDSGYEILVASDAVGMGLNLNIRRIIFHTIYKHDGTSIIRLTHNDVKQIGGRAGRRNSPYPQGFVTCRDDNDIQYIQTCIQTDIGPITKAGLMPMADHLEAFRDTLETTGLMHKGDHPSEYDFGLDASNKEDNTTNKLTITNNTSQWGQGSVSPRRNDLYHVLKSFAELANVEGDYFLRRSESMMEIAQLLEDVDLPLQQKYMFCISPVSLGSQQSKKAHRRYAHSVANNVQYIPLSSHEPNPADSFDDLSNLCSIVNQVDLYFWVQRRFPNQVADTSDLDQVDNDDDDDNEPSYQERMEEEQALAMERREDAVNYINDALMETDSLSLKHNYHEQDYWIRRRYRSKT